MELIAVMFLHFGSIAIMFPLEKMPHSVHMYMLFMVKSKIVTNVQELMIGIKDFYFVSDVIQ